MDKIIMVTVGIPVYNAGRFLSDAITSVLAQSYQYFELIITDDGSIDNSLEIAKSFNDKRITVISDGKNKGIAYRLNEQISLAKGKFFVRMDADDLMFPDRVEKQISFLESYPEIDVIGSQAVVINDENEIIGIRDTTIPKSIIEVFRRPVFIHPTVAGKIEWFRKYKYKYGMEDFDLWIRSFNNSKFYKLQEPLLYYRDPLQIKLNTYRFRQHHIRKHIWDNSNLVKNKKHLIWFSLETYLKFILFQIASWVNLENIFIAHRNLTIIGDKKFLYNDLLKRIIK